MNEELHIFVNVVIDLIAIDQKGISAWKTHRDDLWKMVDPGK